MVKNWGGAFEAVVAGVGAGVGGGRGEGRGGREEAG